MVYRTTKKNMSLILFMIDYCRDRIWLRSRYLTFAWYQSKGIGTWGKLNGLRREVKFDKEVRHITLVFGGYIGMLNELKAIERVGGNSKSGILYKITKRTIPTLKDLIDDKIVFKTLGYRKPNLWIDKLSKQDLEDKFLQYDKDIIPLEHLGKEGVVDEKFRKLWEVK